MADLYRAPDEWFVVRYLDGKPWQRYAVVRFGGWPLERFVYAHEEGERTFFLRASKAEEQAEWLNFTDGLSVHLTSRESAADAVERGVADFKAAALAALDRSHRGCG